MTQNMGSVNRDLDEEPALRKGRFVAFQMGTMLFLLATSAAKLYTALFVAGASSAWFVPALAGGVACLVVAAACRKGEPRAFKVAAAVGALTVVLDVAASGGLSATGAIILGPSALVLIFATLALVQLRTIETVGRKAASGQLP
jgi:hypothetical protein